MKYFTYLLIITAAAAGVCRADGAGVVAAEVGCGYVGGIGVGMAGIPVGNIFSTEQYAGGGLWGFLIAYPAGVGLGVYAAGEIWGDDSENDWASVGASVAAAYASAATGYFTAKFKGLLIGALAAPVASTAAYNLVKNATDENADGEGDRGFYIYTSFNF